MVLSIPSENDYIELQALLSGKDQIVLNTDTEDYNDSLKVSWLQWFGSPIAIIYCKTETDVVKVIEFIGRYNDVNFQIRGGGNSLGGFSSCYDTENCIILDIIQLDSMSYNEEEDVFILGAGISMEEFGNWLSNQNITNKLILTGALGSITFGGYTLAGGISYLGNYFGYSADYLLEARIVTANGDIKIARCTENDGGQHRWGNRNRRYKHCELLKALRGSGIGNFGVVTQLTYKAITVVPTMPYFTAILPLQAGEIALQIWRDLVYGSIPPSLSASFNIVPVFNSTIGNFQDEYFVYIYMIWYPTDSSEEAFNYGLNYLKEFIDNFQVLGVNRTSPNVFFSTYEYLELINIFFPYPPPSILSYTPSVLIMDPENLSDEYIAEYFDFYRELLANQTFKRFGYGAQTFFSRFGGKYASFDSDNDLTSVPNRKAWGRKIVGVGGFTDLSAFDVVTNAAEEVSSLLQSLSDQVYYGYMDRFALNLKDDYYGSNYYNNKKIFRRLKKVKKQYDPQNFFNFPLSVPVTRGRKN